MLEEDIPKFFVEVGECVKASGLPFETWYEAHAEEFLAIAKKYMDFHVAEKIRLK
jgi:hypothetical protein